MAEPPFVPGPCVLPGHRGCRDARLWRGTKRDEIVYSCWRGEGFFQSLPVVFAMQAYGSCDRRPERLELAQWSVLLLHRAGIEQIPPIVLPPLPGHAKPAMRKVADAIAQLFAIRRWLSARRDIPEPVMFSETFGPAWTWAVTGHAMEKRTFLGYRKKLVDAGVIHRHDTATRGSRQPHRFLPGRPDMSAAALRALRPTAGRPTPARTSATARAPAEPGRATRGRRRPQATLPGPTTPKPVPAPSPSPRKRTEAHETPAEAIPVVSRDRPMNECVDHERHAGQGWLSTSGRWVCRICHPPAAASLVVAREAR